MEKLKKVVELLDGKGQILVRNAYEYEGGKWFVHCYLESVRKEPLDAEPSHSRYVYMNKESIYREFVSDLDKALGEIIEKLEDMKNEKEN